MIRQKVEEGMKKEGGGGDMLAGGTPALPGRGASGAGSSQSSVAWTWQGLLQEMTSQKQVIHSIHTICNVVFSGGREKLVNLSANLTGMGGFVRTEGVNYAGLGNGGCTKVTIVSLVTVSFL